MAESLQRGMRVIVQGRLRQRSYETKEGEKRTVFEVEVDEVGPSLRSATAKVTRANRSGAQGGPGGGGGFGGGQQQGGGSAVAASRAAAGVATPPAPASPAPATTRGRPALRHPVETRVAAVAGVPRPGGGFSEEPPF